MGHSKLEIISERMERFKGDLGLSATKIIQKHIFHGDTFALSEDQYFDLKSEVAENFNVHPTNVLMVGSGKLGFSIAPHKRFKFFSDSSDIDIAIISEELFNKIWMELHKYKEQGGYWERFDSFTNYLFSGWIRPDKLPPDHLSEFGRAWWEFFRHLQQQGQYGGCAIRAGLYKNISFLEAYQGRCAKQCKENV